LTVVCYGYWIREEGRTRPEDVSVCRIDLATGYAMTAVFGICMVILGSQLSFEGGKKGAELIVMLSDLLRDELGEAARWAFLAGAWGAVFSSLLGVWQCIPYLFADFLPLAKREEKKRGPRPDQCPFARLQGVSLRNGEHSRDRAIADRVSVAAKIQRHPGCRRDADVVGGAFLFAGQAAMGGRAISESDAHQRRPDRHAPVLSDIPGHAGLEADGIAPGAR